ncbi:MAG: Holliday junction resolvase RuvX [Bacteroidales bacterium]|nr:Holliday junction resolvase RuvX [Bacteroidales bacterium]
MESRIIGIDFGRKRIGLAQSDPLGIFASPLETVQYAKIIDYLQSLASAMVIKCFVIGYPVNMNGRPSEAQADVDAFIRRLSRVFPQIPIIKEDERFTSVLAHRAMIDGGMKASDRRDKASVDKISAALILQTYLDRQAQGLIPAAGR